MAQWGNTDDAANSTNYAAAQVKLTPNTVNQTALFGNTTQDAFITGVAVGQFGVSEAEAIAARAAGEKVPHSGWILETVGSGGRAGRVQREVLVAMNTISGDASDDTNLPDFTLSFLTQPANSAVVDSSNGDVATFSVSAVSAPAGATITYLWQYTTEVGNTASFATTAAVAGFSGQTTNTLSVLANTIADGTLVRCVISATGADSVTSQSALLTVVP